MKKLTIQEEETMHAVWQLPEGGGIRDIIEHFEAPPPYTTVASTVKNLEKKGFIKGKKMANSIFYQPRVSQEEYKRAYLSGVVKNYFQNSYKDLVTFFARDKKISPEELKEIISIIKTKK